ncbi:MAG: ferrous iron transport protein A [Firmicutes bacterium HGW-Firmicutes-12]|jgi:Fe2+ transport system protein FeoA|nr:MAG: ferrous iron transport protein A [Firmicutes bacterium HGW-Firmicutes-12]
MKIITLDKLPLGNHATVVRINGNGAIKRRLLEMGIVPNTDINMLRFAPLGDPLEIKTKGCLLSLRKEEAEMVEVQLENEGIEF